MVELETEGELTRAEVASFLREFVDELEGAGPARDIDDRGTGVGDDRSDPHSSGTDARDDPQQTGDRDTGGGRRTEADPPRGGGDDDRPRDTNQITFVVGGESATVTVPETVAFDVEVESRSPLLSSGERQEIEFELSWEIEDPGRGDDTVDMV